MKRLLIVSFALFSLSFIMRGQENPTSGPDYVLENDMESISFSKVIDAPGKVKKDIFELVNNYCSYHYNDGNSSIMSDAEKGYVIAKGSYNEFIRQTDDFLGLAMIYSAPFTIRVDCKDEKVRVIVTVKTYDVRESNWVDKNKNVSFYEETIRYRYPVAKPKKDNKLSAIEKRYAKVFQGLRVQIDETFFSIKNAVNTGNSILETQDW